jgi:hypothetical protein
MTNMVEVFKTNVQRAEEAEMLIRELLGHFPDHKINFDLSDCDRILRVEGKAFPANKVIELLGSNNYRCDILE